MECHTSCRCSLKCVMRTGKCARAATARRPGARAFERRPDCAPASQRQSGGGRAVPSIRVAERSGAQSVRRQRHVIVGAVRIARCIRIRGPRGPGGKPRHEPSRVFGGKTSEGCPEARIMYAPRHPLSRLRSHPLALTPPPQLNTSQSKVLPWVGAVGDFVVLLCARSLGVLFEFGPAAELTDEKSAAVVTYRYFSGLPMLVVPSGPVASFRWPFEHGRLSCLRSSSLLGGTWNGSHAHTWWPSADTEVPRQAQSAS